MRNPNRLYELYNELQTMHMTAFPDLRFGQLMNNFLSWCINTHRCVDIFFPEDDKWIQWFKEYANENSPLYREEK